MKVKFANQDLELVGDIVKVGQKAPNFAAVKNDLSPISLYDFKGIKLISSVPSLDTGVCDLQTKKFNQELNDANVNVITISNDLPFAQARWCQNAGLENIITVSDYLNNDFASKYGTLIKELKLLTRAIFVVDKDNHIVYTEYLSEVSSHPNYAKAIEAVKKLG